MPDHLPDEQPVIEAIEAVAAAYRAAARAVAETGKPRRAFALATMLRDQIGDIEQDAASLRTRMVERIRVDEALRPAHLAESLGVTKQTVGLWLKRAAATEGE